MVISLVLRWNERPDQSEQMLTTYISAQLIRDKEFP